MAAHREGVWTEGGEPLPRPPGRRVRTPLLHDLRPLLPGVAAAAGLGRLVGGSAFLVASVAAGFGLGLLGRRADARRREGRAGAMCEEFGFGPAWAVDLVVRQGDAPTGRDQGVMWVEGERIVFCGGHTSFALAPAQMAGPVRHEPSLSGLRLRLVLPLARETPVGPLSLSFWPVAGDLRAAERDAASLRYALNTVAGRRDHALASSGQWPSLALGPGAASSGALLARALLPVVGWCLFAAAGAAPWPSAGLRAGVFVVLAVGLNGLVMRENAPRWRAWRHRRRLG